MDFKMLCYNVHTTKKFKKNLCLFLKSAEKEKMLEIFKQIPKSPI